MKTIRTVYTYLLGISGILLMLWFILPAVFISYTSMPVAVASALIAFFIFLGSRKRFSEYVAIYFPCLFLTLIYLIIPYSLQLKPAVNILLQMVIFTAPIMLATFFIGLDDGKKSNRYFYKISLLILIACIALVYYRTMVALVENPTVCRLLAIGTYNEYKAEEIRELRMNNVGGFGYSYAIGLIEVFTFYQVVKEKKRKRVLYILITLALIIFIVKSQYMTLLLLCIIINLITCLHFTKSDISKMVIITIIILLILFAGPIVNFLTNLIVGEKLSEKMYAISAFLEGDGYTSKRIDYIKDAFKCFYHHILFGQPNLINNNEIYSVSSHVHSTQIKLLVDVGLVGSLIYNTYLFYLRKYTARLIKKKGNNSAPFTMAFWFFWLLSWLNPVFANYEIPFALFLVIPLLCCIPKQKSNNLSQKSKH